MVRGTKQTNKITNKSKNGDCKMLWQVITKPINLKYLGITAVVLKQPTKSQHLQGGYKLMVSTLLVYIGGGVSSSVNKKRNK